MTLEESVEALFFELETVGDDCLTDAGVASDIAMLVRFAVDAVAAERERCAKAAEAQNDSSCCDNCCGFWIAEKIRSGE